MKNNPGEAESRSLLRDCSTMDASLVERLRATVEMSLEWTEKVLDDLIRLDDDLQAFDATVKRQAQCEPQLVVAGTEDRGQCLEEIAHQTEQSVQRLRNGVRDVMMSMQNQDVIGQAVERAALALEKRAATLGRVADVSDSDELPTDEIAEIHRAYRTEDDLHQSAGQGEDEYKAAA